MIKTEKTTATFSLPELDSNADFEEMLTIEAEEKILYHTIFWSILSLLIIGFSI